MNIFPHPEHDNLKQCWLCFTDICFTDNFSVGHKIGNWRLKSCKATSYFFKLNYIGTVIYMLFLLY